MPKLVVKFDGNAAVTIQGGGISAPEDFDLSIVGLDPKGFPAKINSTGCRRRARGDGPTRPGLHTGRSPGHPSFAPVASDRTQNVSRPFTAIVDVLLG
jgi:predicted outer membrane repeat protein